MHGADWNAMRRTYAPLIEGSRTPDEMRAILRLMIEEFRGEENSRLGLVGAFGYDLLFQFEPIEKKLPRHGHKDLHLFLCDDIWFMDRKKEQVERYQYDFEREAIGTAEPFVERVDAHLRAEALPISH